MSLTSALNTAQSIFNNTGTQSSVVSNNIANAGNSDYVRRQAMITTSMDGAIVTKTARAQEDALFRQFLRASSQDAGQQRLYQGLEDIKATIGGNDYETAPSEYLGVLQEKLQAFGTSPSSMTAAQSVISAAQDVANNLNKSSASIQDIREKADKEIATTVGTLNTLLAQFKTANDAVKSATANGGDPNNALDQRDGLLKQISQIVGITTVTRDNNDVAIYTTAGGTPLFDVIPRDVTFDATDTYTATTVGNGIYVDGVKLEAGKGSTTTGQGSLQALLQIRDDIAPTYQNQLDEIARGLVTMFAEAGNGTPPAPTLPGLFQWTQADGTAGGMPGSTLITGIASTIAVSDAVITSKGGDPMKLRDGAINGTDYDQNANGEEGYSTLLDQYATSMDSPITFDSAAGVDTSSSILEFASNSIGWIEEYRSNASTSAENTSASLSRSDEAYSNETGVNLDEELSLLLDIEQSYKAATKILSTVDEMLKSLLEIAS